MFDLGLVSIHPLDRGTVLVRFGCGCHGSVHPEPPHYCDSPYGPVSINTACDAHHPYTADHGCFRRVLVMPERAADRRAA